MGHTSFYAKMDLAKFGVYTSGQLTADNPVSRSCQTRHELTDGRTDNREAQRKIQTYQISQIQAVFLGKRITWGANFKDFLPKMLFLTR